MQKPRLPDRPMNMLHFPQSTADEVHGLFAHGTKQNGVDYNTYQQHKRTLPMAAQHIQRGEIHPVVSDTQRRRKERAKGKLGAPLKLNMFETENAHLENARKEAGLLAHKTAREAIRRLNRRQGHVVPSQNGKPIVTTFTDELIHPNSGDSTNMIRSALIPARPTGAAVALAKRTQAQIGPPRREKAGYFQIGQQPSSFRFQTAQG